jgi:hypothetical protein
MGFYSKQRDIDYWQVYPLYQKLAAFTKKNVLNN